MVLLDQGRYKDAIRLFKDELSRDPTNDQLYYYLAFAQYHTDGLQKQALQTIDEALKFQTEEPAYYQLKGLILSDLKKYKPALEFIDEALRLDPQYDSAHAAKAYIYSAMDKWKEAEQSARDALSLNADNQFAGNVLANSLRMQNRLDESVQLTSDLLAKDPDDSMSHSNRGWVHLNRKEYEKAQIHFKEALRLNPNFEPARAGMLEAFKARSPLYRVYLQYALFMGRQSQSMQIAIIVGIYIACRTIWGGLKGVMNGPFAFAGYVLIIIVYGLMFWTWLAGGIGNLLVLSDRFARHSLKKDEKLDAIFVGANFFVGILFVLAGILLEIIPLKIIGALMVLSTIPFSLTFTNRNMAGRIFYGGVGIFIVLVGILLAVTGHSSQIPSALKVAAGIGIVLFIAVSWLGAFKFLRD